MRRSTIVALLACSRRPRRAGRGAGAQRLRRHIADRRLPGARQGPEVQLRRLQHPAAADRARRARRRLRIGEPERGAGAVPRGPVHPPGDLRHQPSRAADPELQPGQHHLGLLAALRRKAAVDRDGRGADRRLHPPAAAAHAPFQGAQRQPRQPADQRRAGRLPGRTRGGGRRLRLLHRRPGGEGPHEDAEPAQVGAASRPLPDLRGQALGRGHARRRALHREGDRQGRALGAEAYGFGVPPRG